jgi:hypothetical protein
MRSLPLIRLAASAARHLLPQGEKEATIPLPSWERVAARQRCRVRGLLPEKTTMPEPRKNKSWHDSLPFPRHWLAYIVLKLAVIVLAVVLVLRFWGKL